MPGKRIALASRSAPSDVTKDITASIDAFRRIHRELRVIARKGELTTGLSAAQLFVLSVAVDRPGASVNDIAEATMTDRSSVAAVIDRLVERGLLQRAQSKEDRRRAAVTVTAKGRRAMERAAPPPTARLIAAVRTLSREQVRALAGSLVAVTKALGVAGEPAGMLFEDSPRPRTAAKRRARGG